MAAEPILLGAGLLVGVVVGRWWALLAAAAFGLWVGLTTELEVSPVYLGAAYGAIAAAGIAVGVALRKLLRRLRGR